MKKIIVLTLATVFCAPVLSAQKTFTPEDRDKYINFMYSVKACDYAAVREAVEEEHMPLNLNSRDEAYDTPLIVAVRNDCLNVAFYLLNSGARPMPNKQEMTSPLNLAVAKQRTYDSAADWTDLISLMLEKNASPNFQNSAGENAFIIATKHNHADYVKILAEESSGSGLDRADNIGRTALMWAAYYDYADVAAELLKGGASLKKTDATRRNAEQIAQSTNGETYQLIQSYKQSI